MKHLSRNSLLLLVSLAPLFSTQAEEFSIRGSAQLWEAACERIRADEWRCGAPERLLETREFTLHPQLPARPGEANHASVRIFEGVTLSVFVAWPENEAPVFQTRIDLRGLTTCAMSEYLKTEKPSPLICGARTEYRMIGVSLRDLRTTPPGEFSGS